MSARPLSPSVAFGCVELLGVVSRNAITAEGVLSLSLGAVPARDVLAAVLELSWVTTAPETGLLTLTLKGAAALAAPDDRVRLRHLILDHLYIESPPWLQLAASGRREVLLQAPKGICQVFVDAGLAYGDDPDTVIFWDTLAARARGMRNAVLAETGRMGERLTLAHESRRTGREPKWVALDSNADGYDVLSRVSNKDTRRLTIEVKTSSQAALSGLFHLTRNEWNLALDSLHHVFHLWNVSTDPPDLAILEVEQVAKHVPSDEGHGVWESARIPFAAFECSFSRTPVVVSSSERRPS